MYESICGHPAHNDGGLLVTKDGTSFPIVSAIPKALATMFGFNSPSLGIVPSSLPFTIIFLARNPFIISSIIGAPSSKTKISLHSLHIFSICFLGRGYCEIFKTG